MTFRPGDVVKLRVPRSVQRVGYPRTLDDYAQQLVADHAVQQAIVGLREAGLSALLPERRHRPRPALRLDQEMQYVNTQDPLLRETAYYVAKSLGFGGDERSIHFQPLDDFDPNEAFIVTKVSRAVTGTRGEEYDVDCNASWPVLDGQQRHTLLACVASVEANRGERNWLFLADDVQHIPHLAHGARVRITPRADLPRERWQDAIYNGVSRCFVRATPELNPFYWGIHVDRARTDVNKGDVVSIEPGEDDCLTAARYLNEYRVVYVGPPTRASLRAIK